jgi:hypothetical protein
VRLRGVDALPGRPEFAPLHAHHSVRRGLNAIENYLSCSRSVDPYWFIY